MTTRAAFYGADGEEFADLRQPTQTRGLTIYANGADVEIGWDEKGELLFIELDGVRLHPPGGERR